jgi:hypothetical protein
MTKNKKVLTFLFTLFCFFPFLTFAISEITNKNGDTVTFPFDIPFSEEEIIALKKLKTEDLLKLVKVAEVLKSKNASSTETKLSLPDLQTSNTPTSQTPYFNSETGQYQNKPPTQKTSNQQPIQNQNPFLPQNNPYQDTPFQKYFADSQQAYGGSPTGGYDTSLQTLSREDMKDLPKLGSGGENCQSNFGVNGNMSGTTARVRFDTNRLCVAFGKRIKVIDAKRGCGGPSRHCFGEAIDYEVKSYGDRKQQALLVVAFIALGYNIGSYEKGFPIHSDHEEAGKWKTWSRWAHTNGQAPLPYEDAVRDALSLIGMPANSALEFRSKYGNPPKTLMIQKAKAFLESVYGADSAKFTPVPNS